MIPFYSPPYPYRQISNSVSTNNNRCNSNCFHSVKKMIFIILLCLILFLFLLIIAIKIYLSTRINGKQENNDHSHITHQISLPKGTIDNELPCPISMNNVSWNQKGVIIINRSGRCDSRSYGLCHPNDLFIDNINENLYVVDTDNNRIQKYSLNEQINDSKGTDGITVASQGLISPKSIFVDTKNEDMYILDCSLSNLTNPPELTNYRVQLWRKNSNVGQILINDAGLYAQHGYSHIILDKQMNIYVEAGGNLRKWFSSANYTHFMGIVGRSEALVKYSSFLWEPYGLYIDDNLTMYIIDQQNKKIEKWFSNFILPITIKSNLSTPFGLILDCNQFIYYGDLHENIIYQLNPIINQTRIVLNLNLKRQLEEFGPPPLKMKFDKFYNMFIIDNEYSRIIKHSIL